MSFMTLKHKRVLIECVDTKTFDELSFPEQLKESAVAPEDSQILTKELKYIYVTLRDMLFKAKGYYIGITYRIGSNLSASDYDHHITLMVGDTNMVCVDPTAVYQVIMTPLGTTEADLSEMVEHLVKGLIVDYESL